MFVHVSTHRFTINKKKYQENNFNDILELNRSDLIQQYSILIFF
jgi:hypothetical protein